MLVQDERPPARKPARIITAPGSAVVTPSPAAPPGQSPVPNGGLEAWLQVVGSWVILWETWGLVNTFGVFQACGCRAAPHLPASRLCGG